MSNFWVYRLTSWVGDGKANRHGAICLGERLKKGTYRSTITTIPYSQITGALRAALQLDKPAAAQLHAVGKFTNLNPLEDHLATINMSIRQRVSGAAQIPIETTVLVDVEGEIYLEQNAVTDDLQVQINGLVIKMGAYRNKGLGRCMLTIKDNKHPTVSTSQTYEGYLVSRLPETELARFGITNVIKPIYGYLFQPDESFTRGTYVRALFEKSLVTAPKFLLEA